MSKRLSTKITKVTKNSLFKTICSSCSSCPSWQILSAQQPHRIISLVPNVTEILFAIGAGPQVVAVSTYDVEPPEVRALPTVGALVDPDTERIIALRPDLVITYGSQVDLQTQLKARVDSVLRLSPRRPRAHHGHDARARAADRARRAGRQGGARRSRPRSTRVRKSVAGKPRPKTLLVFGREPGSLRNIYASAGRGFLHDMLTVAGGDDVLQDIEKESAQISTEMILARRARRDHRVERGQPAERRRPQGRARSLVGALSVPAVRNKRVIILTGSGLTVPGPRVIQGIERMAKALTHEAARRAPL